MTNAQSGSFAQTQPTATRPNMAIPFAKREIPGRGL
jgi:hypothetical protein